MPSPSLALKRLHAQIRLDGLEKNREILEIAHHPDRNRREDMGLRETMATPDVMNARRGTHRRRHIILRTVVRRRIKPRLPVLEVIGLPVVTEGRRIEQEMHLLSNPHRLLRDRWILIMVG